MTAELLRLFDPPAGGSAHHHDHQTSLDAARRQRGGCEAEILAVFAWVEPIDGYTDDEICALMPGWNPPTVKSARSRLSKRGVLVSTGATRLSDCRSPMLIWRLA